MEHKRETRLNFRPLVCCALGLAFGVSLYGKCRFGGLAPSDFLLPALLLGAAVFPLSLKRTLALFVSVLLFSGAGALAMHVYSSRFFSETETRESRISGVVLSVYEERGYSVVLLGDLALNGAETGGKCRALLSCTPLPGDELLFTATPERVEEDKIASDGYARYLFSQDIRFTARADEAEVTGRTSNPFLRLNAALFSSLRTNLGGDGADVVYALLTGNSNGMDEGLLSAVRTGGIAHIFAVSGMHIGILFGAVCLLARPLKKYRFLPASLLAFGYAALCNFTVSSVRAAVVLTGYGLCRAFGRKYDALESLSLSALLILLIAPAEWYATGFRLTFGACIGLALFYPPLSRLLRRMRVPRFLSGYLVSYLSVQIFLFPILLDCFGYFPVWGSVLNFFLLPVLPVLFLVCLVCSLFALAIPPAAGFFLALPEGMIALFLWIVSITDFSGVISGFTLGAGAVVWPVAFIVLSGRIRLGGRTRAVAAVGFAAMFALAVLFENVVFVGCGIEISKGREGMLAYLRTGTERVLIVGEGATLAECEDFLLRTGAPDAVVILAEEEQSAFHAAAFLPAEVIYACDEIETGLLKADIRFGEAFSVGKLAFRFESREKLLLQAEGVSVEFDFGGRPALGADYFVGEKTAHLKFFLKDGKIYG